MVLYLSPNAGDTGQALNTMVIRAAAHDSSSGKNARASSSIADLLKLQERRRLEIFVPDKDALGAK